MANVKVDVERLTVELTRRGMELKDLLAGDHRVSTNVLAKVRQGLPIRQGSALKIAAKLEAQPVRAAIDAILLSSRPEIEERAS